MATVFIRDKKERHAKRRRPCEDGGTAKEHLMPPGSKKYTDSSSPLGHGNRYRTAAILMVRMNFCSFSHQICGDSLQQPQEINTDGNTIRDHFSSI